MPYGIKRLFVCCLHLVTWPLGQPARIAHKWNGSEALFDFSSKLLSLLPGKIGQYLRTSFYMQTLAECHYDIAVAFGAFFSHPTARVGRSVSIGSYSIVGTAELGDGVEIASRVSILSGRHQHGSGLQGSLVKEPMYESVRVGEGCWIGEGAIVMASLGSHCIVGAGSVVTKPTPERSIVAGNPARFLTRKERHDSA